MRLIVTRPGARCDAHGEGADPPRPCGDPLADARHRSDPRCADFRCALPGGAGDEQQRRARACRRGRPGHCRATRRSSRSGDRTALEAKRAGFVAARSAGGALDDLVALAAAELSPGEARFSTRRARTGRAMSPRGLRLAASRSRPPFSTAPRRARNLRASRRLPCESGAWTASCSIRAAARARSARRCKPPASRRFPKTSPASAFRRRRRSRSGRSRRDACSSPKSPTRFTSLPLSSAPLRRRKAGRARRRSPSRATAGSFEVHLCL